MNRASWQVPTLMLLVLALGVWLLWSNKTAIYGPTPAPGTRTVELRVGNTRGVVEVSSSLDNAPPSFRILQRDGSASAPLDADQFRALFGQRALADALAPRDSVAFRLLNITSWTSLIWAGLGLVGQLAFFGRMFVQWLASERARASVVPPAFWWLSLVGGVLLFTYFVWRQDFVGVLGQSTGVVIYARNLRLLAKSPRSPIEGTGEINGPDGTPP